MPSLFGEYLSDILSNTKEVVLYGAGSAGRELFECLQLHKIKVSCFCDKNSNLIGESLYDLDIISVDELMCDYKDSVIVVASNNFKYEISSELKDRGFLNVSFIKDNKKLFYYLQIYKWHYQLATLNENKVNLAYELLEDDKSRALFVKRIALLTSYADYALFNEYISEFSNVEQVNKLDFSVSDIVENFESYLYFNNDILQVSDNDILLDAGAFDGDSALEFVNACDRTNVNYKHVYCIEADIDNYEKLVKNIQYYENISCVNIGLWSKKTRLKFATSNNMFVTESRIVDDSVEMNQGSNRSDGDIYINTESIDELFLDKGVSFIKMDIEGAETEALKGISLHTSFY